MEKDRVEEVTKDTADTLENIKVKDEEKISQTNRKAKEGKDNILPNKHLLAKSKIEEAEARIKSADEEIEECLSKIESDLAGFKGIEHSFVEKTLKNSQKYLKDLGVSDSVIQSTPEPQVDLNDPDLKPVNIKKISSGKFKGFAWGLIAALAAMIGWCYSAVQALGLPLLPEKFPDLERINKVLEWTSDKLGQGANVSVGAAVVIVGFLAIWFLIYWLVKTLTASSNLRTAARIEEDAEFYCSKKGECKEQMQKVREHIAHAKKLIEKYDVLLAEQNAKLQRALFVEEADKYDALHAKTQTEIGKMKKLVSQIERFLKTPMAEHGILSKEGVEILEKANKAANDHIMEMYK